MAAAQPVSDSQASFYVYIHRRETDGAVFYVGKGRRRRAYSTKGRNLDWQRTFEQHGLVVELLRSDLEETMAFELEREMIAVYGRDNLCNRSDGGEGATGLVLSAVHKRSMLEASRKFHLGHKRPLEWVARSSASRTFRKPRETGTTKSKKIRASWTPDRRAAQANRAAQNSRKAVICVETGERFESLKAAGEWLASTSEYRTYCKISTCCGGGCASAYGYRWRYAD